MTIQSRATLKAKFEDGDVPTGDDYANLIDSAVNLADTSAQALSSELSATKLVTPDLSAASSYTGATSADSIHVSGGITVLGGITVSGHVSAGEIFGANLTIVSAVAAKDATFTGAVSAATVEMSTMVLNVATTAQASGGAVLASVVPTTAQGFLEATIGGTVYVIPYFKRKSG